MLQPRRLSLFLLMFLIPPVIAGKYGDNNKELLVYEKIRQHYNEGNTFESHRLSIQFVKTFPKSIRNAEIYYILGETETVFYRSIANLRKVVKDYPSSLWGIKAQLSIGLKYYSIGNYKQAISELKKFILNYPNAKDIYKAHYFRGLSFYQLNTFKEAGQDFKFVHEKSNEPDLKTKSSVYLGHVSASMKNYQQAILYYSAALSSINSTSLKPIILEKLGISYTKVNAKEKGLKIFKDLIAQYPNSPSAKRISRIYF